MKHRSVIAFFIVAAALFAAPQLSHDLQGLRSGLGARLRGELLQAFLSLHPEDGAAAAPNAREARTLLAICPKSRAEAPAAKAKKDEPRAAAQQQSEETADGGPAVQLAMMTEPANAPDVWTADAARDHINAVGEAVAAPARVEADTEVAMIIPPDAGLDPPPPTELSAARMKARAGASQKRREAEGLLRATFIATGFDGQKLDLQGPAAESLRRLSETLPGSFEFRFEGNGSKAKTMKFIKRTVEAARPSAAAPAPRATRLPGLVACVAPMPAAETRALTAGE
jgi:hypothetical protein